MPFYTIYGFIEGRDDDAAYTDAVLGSVLRKYDPAEIQVELEIASKLSSPRITTLSIELAEPSVDPQNASASLLRKLFSTQNRQWRRWHEVVLEINKNLLRKANAVASFTSGLNNKFPGAPGEDDVEAVAESICKALTQHQYAHFYPWIDSMHTWIIGFKPGSEIHKAILNRQEFLASFKRLSQGRQAEIFEDEYSRPQFLWDS